ncbi:hypothetical protein EI94DRAFT_1165465 [Lactarius quietus]|nr:hypothetical protein EI94DRAFT_1165465 [Lactarius quietus]
MIQARVQRPTMTRSCGQTPYYITAELLLVTITIQTANGIMSMEPLFGEGSAPEAPTKMEAKLPHEHPFYFYDSQVVLKVESQIYRIHRYFLVRESEFFRDLFSLPQGAAARVEGVDDEHPIFIPGTTIAEFDGLLRFFYFGMHSDYKPTAAEWISILCISTRLICTKVRENAINELTSVLEEVDPFDLIGLAIKCDVQQWLKPTYRRIAKRAELITHAEAGKISFPIAVMLMRSHERYSMRKAKGADPGLSDIIRSEVRLMEES